MDSLGATLILRRRIQAGSLDETVCCAAGIPCGAFPGSAHVSSDRLPGTVRASTKSSGRKGTASS